jgi:hypothetical protein
VEIYKRNILIKIKAPPLKEANGGTLIKIIILLEIALLPYGPL